MKTEKRKARLVEALEFLPTLRQDTSCEPASLLMIMCNIKMELASVVRLHKAVKSLAAVLVCLYCLEGVGSLF